jgi:hypothetical protein
MFEGTTGRVEMVIYGLVVLSSTEFEREFDRAESAELDWDCSGF